MPASEKPRRTPSGDGPFVVGLVGRAGSGKSSVARALERVGAVVLDADRIGHEVTDRDPAVRAALIADYGPAVYLEDGTLNRRLVATAVFSNPAALAALNRLVHPRILAVLRERLSRLANRGGATVVVDAALMLDWAFERECDAVVAVTAPEALRIERLGRARGWSAAEAQRRLAAQRDDAAFAAAADVVLENRGSEAELAAAAVAALERLRAAPRRESS